MYRISRGLSTMPKRHVKDIPDRKQSKNVAREKKPFNKKEYRLQKYSNKYKINQWEQRRKKAILRGFYKELDKDSQQNPKKLSLFESDDSIGNQKQPKKASAFQKAKQEFLHKKDEKLKQQEETSRVKAERQEALKKYKERRMQTYKKLCKKTKRGQPVMKDRLELLLEKIQQQMSE